LGVVADQAAGERRGAFHCGPLYQWVHGVVARLLERAVATGEAAVDDCVYTADALLAAVDVDLYLFQRRERGYTPEQIRAGLRRLVAGLRARSAAEGRERVSRFANLRQGEPLMNVLVVTIVAREGKEAEVEALLREMVRQTRQEPGNLVYTLHRSTEDPRRFLLYELYRDQTAIEAHQQAPYFRAYLERAPDLLASRERQWFEVLAS
ncbi:MAG: antibiotic biosynthesis monooxygenase, partial [Chloroflexi bacterium]|nr:antibiotic biosynthesis monooxygenase [Chloroflexota bacterium]